MLLGLVAFLYSYQLFIAFSLGFDICGNPENDPPQQSDPQQPGKQFDHDSSYICKSIMLFKLYVCIATLF
ncbi:MAG: hypothetical protein ACRC4N_17245, partial [Gammaproteobacteria bacterium]